ncbi:MAG TPA: CdaR family protein [Fimbriimonas sp.]
MKNINIPLMLFSLLISVVLWMVVYAQNTKPMTPVRYAVKLTQEGLPEDRYIVTEMDEIFRFAAVGPEDKLVDIRSDDLAALVDLTDAKPGTRRYPVKIYPEAIEEFATNKFLSTLVTIEPVERKTVRVRVEGQGQLRNSKYRLTDTVADPPEVVVRGAKSVVDKAASARVIYDLSTVDTSSSRPVSLSVDVVDREGKPLNEDLIRTDPLFVRISPVLDVAPEQKTIFVSPRYRGQIAQGYVSEGAFVEPKQVTLQGASLALAAISKVQTQPIDITGLKETTTFTVPLQVPTGLRVVRGEETVRVRVIVREATVPQSPPPAEPE